MRSSGAFLPYALSLALTAFIGEFLYGMTSFGIAITFQFGNTISGMVGISDGSVEGAVDNLTVAGVFMAFFQAVNLRQDIAWPFFAVMAFWMYPFIFLGTWLLLHIHSPWLKRILGVFILVLTFQRAHDAWVRHQREKEAAEEEEKEERERATGSGAGGTINWERAYSPTSIVEEESGYRSEGKEYEECGVLMSNTIPHGIGRESDREEKESEKEEAKDDEGEIDDTAGRRRRAFIIRGTTKAPRQSHQEGRRYPDLSSVTNHLHIALFFSISGLLAGLCGVAGPVGH